MHTTALSILIKTVWVRKSLHTSQVVYQAGTHSMKYEATRIIFISLAYDASSRRVTASIKVPTTSKNFIFLPDVMSPNEL